MGKTRICPVFLVASPNHRSPPLTKEGGKRGKTNICKWMDMHALAIRKSSFSVPPLSPLFLLEPAAAALVSSPAFSEAPISVHDDDRDRRLLLLSSESSASDAIHHRFFFFAFVADSCLK